MKKDDRRKGKGFAAMSPEKQRQASSKGGRAAHEKGVAYKWTSAEASKAGRKGGLSRARGRAVAPTKAEIESAAEGVI